ncbi:MAG: hypothetical protein ACN0LA_11220 [Candidatus Longimicrobiales bacterium M2_2A_002]
MSWKERLKQLVGQEHPRRGDREEVQRFLREVVAPALEQVADELARHDREAALEVDDDEVSITVFDGDEEEFRYAVKARTFRKASFAFPELTFRDDDRDTYHRAMVYTHEGARNYGIMGYDADGVIDNFMYEYDRQLRWQAPTRPRD